MNIKDAMVRRLRNYIEQSIRKDRSTVILYLNEVEDIIEMLSETNNNNKPTPTTDPIAEQILKMRLKG